MNRLTLISSDCHAGARPEVYREYIDPEYLDAYDEWLKAFGLHGYQFGGTKLRNVGKRRVDELEMEDRRSDGRQGAWDVDIRAREMDREGLAGEVIFPDGIAQGHAPFGAGLVDPRMGTPVEHMQAGSRAYNRWLTDFCNDKESERHAGVAVIRLDDIQMAVKEIEWARKAGLFGGVMLPGLSLFADKPTDFWHHPRFEPIWETCAALDMPIHTHAGAGQTPNYGEIPGSRWLASIETWWVAFRVVWFLLWGGVLHRHPRLKVVVTEAGSGGIAHLADLFDYMAAERNPEAAREIFTLKPSEYLQRQVYLGASTPVHRVEVEARHKIGVDKIMWGSDYPHGEGTWPRSAERLRQMFSDVPEREVRMMVGENAAHVYGFDLKKLAAIAERIGPTASDLGAIPASNEAANRR